LGTSPYTKSRISFNFITKKTACQVFFLSFS